MEPGPGAGVCVATELDIRLVNRWTAFLNIGLTLFVVFELVLVSALLTRVTNRLVVDPLTRVFANIRRNMDRIMGVLEHGKKKPSGDFDDVSSDSDSDGDSMTHFEATIEKMSRLLTHVAGSGAQGSHVFNEYLNDVNVDENTRAWLTDMKGAGGTFFFISVWAIVLTSCFGHRGVHQLEAERRPGPTGGLGEA